jgi:hypothetical protein
MSLFCGVLSGLRHAGVNEGHTLLAMRPGRKPPSVLIMAHALSISRFASNITESRHFGAILHCLLSVPLYAVLTLTTGASMAESQVSSMKCLLKQCGKPLSADETGTVEICANLRGFTIRRRGCCCEFT